jgi:putative ABC transport system permease protein
MKHERLLDASDRWFRLLQRLYPVDFRDEMGHALVETYRDRARDALNRRGVLGLVGLWIRALIDSLRNGPGERARPAVSWRRTGNWGRDVEFATRRLIRAPGLALAMTATLTVGLGMFAVIYTVVQKVLIEPLPYKDPDDLYFAWRDYRPRFDLNRGWLGGTDVAELQKAGGVIEDAAALLRQLATFSVREGADAMEIPVMLTSPNLFELVGVQPILGRGFARTEVGPNRPQVIVLTYDLWNRLGADPAILGTTVRLNGQPFTVIGVMPPTFRFMRHASLGSAQRVDAYVPLNVNLAETNPDAGSYGGIIRVRRGTPPELVTSAVTTVGRAIDEKYFKSGGLKIYPTGLKADLIAGVKPALLVLGFAAVVLVLVLMVNLGSVLLARTAQREHEFAVSRALGANSGAIARATLFEGALLGLAGGIAAAAAAVWGTRALVALAPLDLPRLETIAVDWRIGAVVVGVGIALGVLAAIAPAIWATRTTLASLLSSSAVRGGGGHGRLRRGMVVAQVTLSLVLLTTGGLIVRSFDRLLRADPGFKPGGVLSVRVPIPVQFVAETADALALQERLEAALASIPGVTGVSAASALPLTAGAGQRSITFPGAPGNTGDKNRDSPLVDVIGARATYVEVMGMRVIAGRPFDRVRREGVREALIDRSLAEQFFPTGSAIGATIPYDNKQTLTIVGVVDQARLYDAHQDGRPQVYLRAEDWGYRTLNFVVRGDRVPETMIPDVRSTIQRIDPRLAVANARTMDEIVESSIRRQRLSAVLISSFALGALLLAAIGLFGVVSNSVTRRRHELAVRLAVGADHGALLRLVLADAAMLVLLGALIGVPGIYVVGQWISGLLVGVSPLDPLTLAIVVAGLGAVTMIACYVPARRVLSIDPAQSLRQG